MKIRVRVRVRVRFRFWGLESRVRVLDFGFWV